MSLEERIEQEMAGFEGEYAVYAETRDGQVIEINADYVWETASCIKVAVLLELYRRIAIGEISATDPIIFNKKNHSMGSGVLRFLTPSLKLSLKDTAMLMIIISDNVATNMLIDFLGQDQINNTCMELGLTQTRLLKKIFFFPDTDTVIGQTTPREFVEMFKLIQGNVFDPKASLEMLDILKNQMYNQLLTRRLPISMLQSKHPGEDPEIQIASKSGSLKNCRNDGGIIYTPWGFYYVAVFTRNFADPYYYADHTAYQWAPRINSVLYQHFAAREGSF